MARCFTQRNRRCAYVESSVYKRTLAVSALPGHVTSRSLGNRAHHHLVDVHMGWPGDRPDDAVGDIRAGQRLHSVIDRLGPLLVALESDQAELRLDHARLDL